MSTCVGCVTSFQTFHGTGIQGIWITWGNTATSKTGDITATDELSIDMELRMYAANLNTRNYPVPTGAATGTTPIELSASDNHDFHWYLLFMNPNVTVTSPNAASGTPATIAQTLWDGAFGNIRFSGSPGAGNTKDTITATWQTPNLKDQHCTADYGAAFAAVCTEDDAGTGQNNAVAVTAIGEDQCIEKWNIVNEGIRCVRLRSQWKRFFLTPETGATNDIDLGYRPFQVSTGWKFTAVATSPYQIAFPKQSVDLGRFRRGTPEADYNGAIDMGVTCGALAAAIMTFLF